MKITFKDAGHKEFYQQIQKDCRTWDSYHMALFYALGISPDCRKHVNDIFCFKGADYGIKPDTVFSQGWLTSGCLDCIRVGYNLFNGFTDGFTAPDSLFSGEYAPYLLQAVKLRFPDAFNGVQYEVRDKQGHVLAEGLCPRMIAESYVKIYEREYGGTYTITEQAEISIEV